MNQVYDLYVLGFQYFKHGLKMLMNVIPFRETDGNE